MRRGDGTRKESGIHTRKEARAAQDHRPGPPQQAKPSFVDPQQRAALIAQAAYFRAMRRGFAPGHEVEDWLAAEAEVDAGLLSGGPHSSA